MYSLSAGHWAFLRGPLRRLASDIFLTRGSKCTSRRKTILIAYFLRGHVNLLFLLSFDPKFFKAVSIRFGDVARNVSIYCYSMLSSFLNLKNAHTVRRRAHTKK